MDMQLNALNGAGCNEIYTDRGISGAVSERPGVREVISSLRRGDMLVVWRLDRLGRSLVSLVELVNKIGQQGIEFRSLNESIDASSSGGRSMFHIMAALAEFERSLISERTKAGMEAARLKGKHLGRPPKLKPADRNAIIKAVRDKGNSISEIAMKYKITPQTARLIAKAR